MATRKIASLAKQRNQFHSKDTILLTKLMKIAKRKKTACSRKYPNYLVTALLQATVMRLESDKSRVQMVGRFPKDIQSVNIDDANYRNTIYKQSISGVNRNVNSYNVDTIEMELDIFFDSLKSN